MEAKNGMESNRDLFIKKIFSVVAPHIDPLTTGFSFGLCHLWRRKVISLSGIRNGTRVLDVCTGTGELALLLAKRVGYDGSVTGVDFCEEMLEEARRKANSHVPNLSFQAGDAKDLHFEDDTFDIVTVSFGMRNVPDTALALKEARRVLKPGGKFFCLELTRPLNPWVLPFYKFYTFQVMPRIANMIIKTDTPYSYLPRSIDAFFSPQTFKNVIEQCGFSDVRLYSLNLGVATIFRAVKP